jgi:hypothetical protein
LNVGRSRGERRSVFPALNPDTRDSGTDTVDRVRRARARDLQRPVSAVMAFLRGSRLCSPFSLAGAMIATIV